MTERKRPTIHERSAPWESDANTIENKAMDMLYEENEAERWFKVEKL